MNEDRNIALIFGWKPETVQRDTDGTVRVSWFPVNKRIAVLYPGRCHNGTGDCEARSKALDEAAKKKTK